MYRARLHRVRAELLQRARRDPRVTAAALTGSAAASTDDEWSDLDLFIGVDCADPADVLNDFSAAMYDGFEALHHFDLVTGQAVYRAFLLEGPVEVDLGFAPRADFRSHGGAPFEVVFGAAQPASPTPELDVGHIIGLIWHHVLHARSSLERGRPWQAEHCISALRAQVITLAAHRHGLPTAYAKGADLLPVEITAQLEGTLVASLDAEALRAALRAATLAAITEITQHTPAVAERLRASLHAAGGPPPAR